MAILYVFNITGPTDVSPLPPSVGSSEWFSTLSAYLTAHDVNPASYEYMLHFRDQAELDSFISTYKLTDATLIADLTAWKSTYGFEFDYYYYTLTDATITPTPDPLLLA